MKLFMVLLGILCLVFVETRSQGFVQPHDPKQSNLFRRQLTSAQQSNILTDIQEHQHRFNLNPSQQQFLVQQQPSIEISVAPTQQTIVNQRPPPLQQQQQQQHLPNQIRFPQNFNRNNFQSPNNNNSPIVQHHTQTNFIPNFVHQNQQQQSPPQQNFQYQRSLQNQLNYPQQPFQPQQTQHQQQQQQVAASNVPFIQAPTQYQALPQFQPTTQFQPTPQFQPVPPPSFASNQQIPNGVQQQLIQQSQFQVAPNKQQPQFQAAPQFQTAPQFENLGQFRTAPQFSQFDSGIPITKSEQEAKQKLIEKHEQFVQKQYEKQQNQVKQLHDEFLQKQQLIKQIGLSGAGGDSNQQNAKSRGILPSETDLFQSALKKYNQEHPTTTLTTTTTTENDRTKNAQDPFELLLQAQRKDIYAELGLEDDKPKSPRIKGKQSKEREDLLNQLKKALGEDSNLSIDGNNILLPNGQKVQFLQDPNIGGGLQQTTNTLSNNDNKNNDNNNDDKGNPKEIDPQLKQIAPLTSMDLVLPNGEKVEIVRAPDPSSIGGVTDLSGDIASLYTQSLANEAKIVSSDDGPPSIEELAKRGLIPEGYEIVQQPAPGSQAAAAAATQKAAEPPKAPPKKKATYVYLEEQPDGSFKVQGVKANGEKEAKTTGAEVDSILDRIKTGDIKLPPSVKKVQLPSELEPEEDTPKPVIRSSTPQPITASTTSATTPLPPRVTFPSSTVSPYSTLSPAISTTYPSSSSRLSTASSTYQTTLSPISTYNPVTEHLVATTISRQYRPTPQPQQPQPQEHSYQEDVNEQTEPNLDLIKILKSSGLYAMAKYLKQSGLDSILNETGPYTVFAPTDKAFKSLLIQLGGPERAEEKFKANPRLLSGLLLHHVIPGSFVISSLQDEMTGVSLAGTQLRVNQYSMHDQEWNDVLITTINGAMIITDKQDIKIPQGTAHAVDRVMFPLPVGDLLQTLQSDREKRFTNFLKILYSSGLSELLQNKGTKTYTVFAPTDKAFTDLDPEDLQKLTNDKDASQAFAMRHIVPGTLFSAGMRFYQVKDSLLPGQTITLQKTSSGKIKVNESQMVTSNIPGTNGVIHALDGIL